MPQVPPVTLNNGVRMPQLGFGVWQVPPEDAETAVSHALAAGYRSIDTAAAYENEDGVGKAIAASGIARKDLFITSKLWNSATVTWDRDAVRRAFDASLQRLGLDYLDMYLIHWPRPMRDSYLDIWRAFEELYNEGRIRAIGVSNFQPAHLRRLLDETSVCPAVNQVELHPNFTQPELRELHAENGIYTEAWSPLGQGKGLLEEQALRTLADKHNRTPAQIVLRWHVQLGNIVIPKSVTPERIKSNIQVFDFQLDDEDLSTIAAMGQGPRLGGDPDTFDWK